METRDSRRQERGAGPGPVRTVCDGARQLLLQRTPTEGSYQQSLFEKFLGTVVRLQNVSRGLLHFPNCCFCNLWIGKFDQAQSL